MDENSPVADLRGITRLAIDATARMADLVEAVHENVERRVAPIAGPVHGPIRGVRVLVYGSVRGITRLTGAAIDVVLAQFAPLVGGQSTWPGRDVLLAALNGVLGDYLAASGNPLATAMALCYDGQRLQLDRKALAAAIPQAGGKLAVLVHGLCMNDLQWTRLGQNYGASLSRDLGYTSVFLRYNSGCHISTNGRAFAGALEALVRQWPVPVRELTIIGHSLGGLVARSACHYAKLQGQAWPRHLKKLVFIGTPHHGAPLERGGHWVDLILGGNPFTAPFARLGKIRSAAITDLRHGNLLDEDWEGRDRFEHSADHPRPVPLPEGVRCYAIAATTARQHADLNGRLPGDGLVPVNSALGRHDDPARALPFPVARQWLAHDMNHMDLIGRAEVYEQIRQWLAEGLNPPS